MRNTLVTAWILANLTCFGRPQEPEQMRTPAEMMALMDKDLHGRAEAMYGSDLAALRNALVNGTRKTWVTAYTPVGGNTSFVFARVRVRVEFWSEGRGLQNQRSTSAGAQPFFYEMTTLRSLD